MQILCRFNFTRYWYAEYNLIGGLFTNDCVCRFARYMRGIAMEDLILRRFTVGMWACHTACSYRVASLRNKHLALKTKEQEMKQRWQPKILVIQDEINLVSAAVENMMHYRSMRARQDEGLDPASYFHPGELMGHIPILLIAGVFLQIKPANDDPQNAAQSADRTPYCPGGIDDH